MSVHNEEFWICDKDEVNICLTCKQKKCVGDCERLRQEKEKLKKKNKKGVK